MKIRLTLKDPDEFYDRVKDAVYQEVDKIEGIDDDEKDSLLDVRSDKVWVCLSRWVTHQEQVTIEFDTNDCTATVVPND